MIKTVDGSLKFDTKIDTKNFEKGTNTIKSQANGLKRTMLSLGKVFAGVFAVKKLIDFSKQAVGMASSLQEVQNVVDTAFGSMAYKMEEFAKTSIETFGISKLSAKQTGSTFMAMARGMGIAMDTASDMSIALTGLSADMSSFYNMSQEETSTALKGIFTGETEALKRYGLVMTEVNLQQYAYSQGIKKKVSAMTQDEKVLLRYRYIMEQTKLAQGDFAKTSNSWANQTRMLSEKWKEFLGILGQGLIKVLAPVVRFLNTVMSQLITFANTAGKVLNAVLNVNKASSQTAKTTAAIGTGASDASQGLSDMGDSAKDAAKKMNKNTSSFDQLNNMTESIAGNSEDASSALLGMGGASFDMEMDGPKIKEADTSALEQSLINAKERIQTNLKSFISYIKTNFEPIFTKTWSDMQPHILKFKEIVAGVFSDLTTLIQPLVEYVDEYLVPYFQTAFEELGKSANGLFDTFNKVFSDIWNIAIYPLLENLVTVALPMFTEFGTKVWEVLGVLFEEIKKIFDMIWKDAMEPALKLATKIWTDFIKLLSDFWKKWGAPIFENIKTAIRTTGDVLKTVWEKYLKPIWDTFMKTVDKLWTNHLKPLLANFLDLVGELVNGALEIYNKFIAPLVKWFVEMFGPPISKVISGIITIFGNFLGGVIDAVSGIVTALKGVIQFVVGVFTGDWKKAWEGVKNIFKGVFDALVGIVKTPINLIIDIINGMISGIVSGINTLIRSLNKFAINVPDIPGVTKGFKIGFNLGEVTAPKIPKLATGTVVPANYGEFMAILGDNKRETEVVSPLSTMKQALLEAMREYGGGGNGDVHVYLEGDAQGVFKLVRKADKEYYDMTGKPAFVH